MDRDVKNQSGPATPANEPFVRNGAVAELKGPANDRMATLIASGMVTGIASSAIAATFDRGADELAKLY